MIDTTHLLDDTGNVKAARAAILAMAEQLNAMIFPDPIFSGLTTMNGGQVWGVVFGNPASGDTVAITAATRMYVNINPTTRAALTFNLPASPTNRQVVRISTDGAITALTVNDSAGVAANVLNAPTTLAVGEHCEFVYRNVVAKWIKCG
jgi:hypothetical protein